MTKTLFVKDTIQRVGYTVIDGVNVVQHMCTIDSDNPEKMSVKMLKLDVEKYKQYREICRNDFAVFEDAAYELQAELISKKSE